MKTLIILSSLFFIANAEFSEWYNFKTQFDKNYISSIEEKYRLQTYLNNRRMIAEHNENYRRGKVSFELEINEFGDMTDNEFRNMMYTGLQKSNFLREEFEVKSIPSVRTPIDFNVPYAVDWRARGGVTPVKNQGLGCGSCWAFSATGALEGHYFSKTKQLISLSEQNLVDCSSYYGNAGCNGGLMNWAFQYVIFNGGLDTEESYPYEGVDFRPCRYDMRNIGATAESYSILSEGDEEQMKTVLANEGPVSVAIHASNPSFRFYKSGVYYEPRCNASTLDHGVLVIGYNTSDSNEDYWLVKNSWGTKWGDAGYIKIARNRDNHCGIVSMASYPRISIDFQKLED